MAIIKVEEYTCDICGKPIKLEEVHIGTLRTRRRGARGRGAEVTLAMHHSCIPAVQNPSPSRAKPNGRPARRPRTAAKA